MRALSGWDRKKEEGTKEIIKKEGRMSKERNKGLGKNAVERSEKLRMDRTIERIE